MGRSMARRAVEKVQAAVQYSIYQSRKCSDAAAEVVFQALQAREVGALGRLGEMCNAGLQAICMVTTVEHGDVAGSNATLVLLLNTTFTCPLSSGIPQFRTLPDSLAHRHHVYFSLPPTNSASTADGDKGHRTGASEFATPRLAPSAAEGYHGAGKLPGQRVDSTYELGALPQLRYFWSGTRWVRKEGISGLDRTSKMVGNQAEVRVQHNNNKNPSLVERLYIL